MGDAAAAAGDGAPQRGQPLPPPPPPPRGVTRTHGAIDEGSDEDARKMRRVEGASATLAPAPPPPSALAAPPSSGVPPHFAGASAAAAAAAAASAPPSGAGAAEQGEKNMSFAEKMMAKMGYKEGKGLGAKEQGIVEPVTASDQSGRRGLGYAGPKGLESRAVTDHVLQNVVVHQEVEWFPSCEEALPPAASFEMEKGEWDLDIGKQAEYIDPRIMAEVLECKTLLDGVSGRVFRLARSKANPFEKIKGEFFQNRAALKMANIDAACEFSFVRSDKFDAEKELLYFADICAGPGGFAEYVMWRMGWRAKGIGFTLRVSGLDFQLAKFNPHSPWDSFFPYYGPEENGDIYSTENMRALRDLAHDATGGRMLHFVSADGGCDFDGNENVQELLNKQLLLCQVAVAMSLLRQGGDFVCKCFELGTGFSVDLMYIVWRHFDQVSLFKPHTSRPANSERFIVARGFKTVSPPVVEYLWAVNDEINRMKAANGGSKFASGGLKQARVTRTGDVKRLLSAAERERAAPFFERMRALNNQFGEQQVAALRKLHNFVRDSALPVEDQDGIREDCLHEWGIPDKNRDLMPVQINDPNGFYHEIVLGDSQLELNRTVRPFDRNVYIGARSPRFATPSDWGCAHMSSGQCGHFMSVSDRHTFIWDIRERRWGHIDGLFLPPGTFVFGELATERDVVRQVDLPCFRIVDALMLGGEDVRQLPYRRRMATALLFVSAIDRDPRTAPQPFRWQGPTIPVRLAAHFSLADVAEAAADVSAGVSVNGALRTRVAGLFIFPVQMLKKPPGFVQKSSDLWEDPKTGKKLTRADVLHSFSFRHTASEIVAWDPHRSGVTATALVTFVQARLAAHRRPSAS